MENAESSSPHDDAANDPLSQALERWFSALDEGREPSLLEAAGGDAVLATELGATLGRNTATIDRLSAPVDGAAPDREGQRFGDFTLLATIGEGASGKVYLARQESLGRLCAVKVLNLAAAGRHDARVRFRREAEIAARLSHRAVVPIYAVGERDGLPFIAMKWLTGPPLDALETPPEPREVARLGAIVARGLHEAHLAGVVHRDVKPANVLLDDGEPVIVDFGLARAADDATLTRADIVPGTLAYVAPELLAREIASADPRTDVYSLGATLYEVATGLPPFVAESSAEMIAAVLHGSPPPPRMDGERDFVTILLRALDRDPRRRFSTCAELADDLERFVRDEPILSRRPGPLERAWRKLRRRPRTAAAILTLSVLASAATASNLTDAARTRREARRELADGKKELTAELLARELAAAKRRADALAAKHPADPELARLAATAACETVCSQVVDALLEASAAWAVLDFVPLERELERRLDDASSRRYALTTLALAARARGDPAAARARLAASVLAADGGTAGWDQRVLARLLADEVPEAHPAELAPREALLGSVALNMFGYLREAADVARENLRGDGADSAQLRAMLTLRSISDEGLESAEEKIALYYRGGEPPRAILRAKAWIALASGRREAAAKALADLGDAASNPAAALLQIELERRHGDAGSAQKALSELEARFPGHLSVALRAAEIAGSAGRFDEAENRVRALLAAPQIFGVRQRCRLLALSIRAARIATEGSQPTTAAAAASRRSPAELRDEALLLADDAAAFARDRLTPRQLAAAKHIEAVTRRSAGENERAEDALGAALAAYQRDSGIWLSRASWSSDDAGGAPPESRRRMLETADAAARNVVELASRTGEAVPRRDVRKAAAIRIQCAAELGRPEAAAAAARAWLDEYGEDDDAAELAERIETAYLNAGG